ncbi:MAG: hypothetical protein ABGX71_09050 [Methyloprofundus sp.]|nr:hypothetical protein [Methyloprofundus sp.]
MTELIYILTTLYGLYVIDRMVGDKLVLFLAMTALVIGIVH